jgi:hypothetical protein
VAIPYCTARPAGNHPFRGSSSQLSGSRLRPIRDCVCANGKGFGGHCCKPVNHPCVHIART